MNEQLTKFIELCLADGVISDKEREVIFRKAKALGVDEDECEILIESYTQQVNKTPDNNKSVTSKQKRNFTPKTVQKIKPAALNQEKKLLEEVTKLKEKEEKISANYDLALDDLKVKAKEINKTKKDTEVDFKKFKASYNKYRKKNTEQYLNNVETSISEKHGKANLTYTAKEKEKLLFSDLGTVNKFILKENNWVKVKYEKRIGIWLGVIIISIIISIIHVIYVYNTHRPGVWVDAFWFYLILDITLFLGFGFWAGSASFEKNDIKTILKGLDTKHRKSFNKLAEQEVFIKKYEKLLKYSLATPKKIECQTKQEIAEILQLLKMKKYYGY